MLFFFFLGLTGFLFFIDYQVLAIISFFSAFFALIDNSKDDDDDDDFGASSYYDPTSTGYWTWGSGSKD